jgi:hypothetical protein
MKYLKKFEDMVITKTHILTEEYGKGVNESYTLQDFISSSKELEDKGLWTPFWDAIRPLINAGKIDINKDWDNLIKMLLKKMDRKELRQPVDAFVKKLGLSIGLSIQLELLSIQLEPFFKSKNVVASEDPTTEKIRILKDFFKRGGTGLESEKIRFIYKHFKKGHSIDSLEDSLKKLYKDSQTIFNFSNFSEKEFIDIIDKVAEGDKSFRENLDKEDDAPSFDISSKGTAVNLR